jgi:uncharacterized phiE125 gp8 family phage protein
MISSRTVEPPFLPITLEEAKASLRITTTDEDSDILGYIYAATEVAENYMQRQLVSATWVLSVPLPTYSNYYGLSPATCWITYLPIGKVTGITTVKYYDSNNALQTLAATNNWEYVDDNAGQYIRWISLPSTYDRTDAIEITYTAGWSAQEEIPESIKVAIKMLVGEFYRHREASAELTMKEVPFSVQRLLNKYRNVRYG